MLIVIDSNILFSALIKDSITRKLILNYDGFFLFPEYIFEEVEKYKGDLLRKSGMNEIEFNQLLELLLRKVRVIPNEVLDPYFNEAYKLADSIDSIEDVLFFACAIAYKESVIWSNDQKLKRQTKIKILNTAEIFNVL